MALMFIEEEFIKRYKNDINKFQDEQKIKNDFGSKELFKVNGDNSLESIRSIINTNILTPISLIYKDNTYINAIPTLDKSSQQSAWQYRTYLFYQILYIELQALLDEKIYEKIFKEYDDKNGLSFPYKPEIDINFLNNVKLGIFGSLTPTSDIDVGFECLNKDPITGALVYILSRFEALFYILTDVSSLQWDIEAYGNLMTLPNRNKKNDKYKEYFNLYTDNLTHNQYTELLEYAGACIMRNVLMHSYDNQLLINNEKKEKIKMTIDKIFEKLFYKNSNFNRYFHIHDMNWLENGKKKAIAYLELINTPLDADKEYYKKLEEADIYRNGLIREKKNNAGDNENIKFNSEENFETIKLFAESSLYRRENYLLPSSIIHVVRTLQGAGKMREKYNTTIPGLWCNDDIREIDGFCSIGTYGYLFSILEQLGYIIRFYITYCTNIEGHYDKEKCEKKYKKYIERIENALIRITNTKKEEGLQFIESIKSLKDNKILGNVSGGKRITKKNKNKNKKKKYTRQKK